MITTVLVANRGEIARRVVRTCRSLGVGTVAVFSDPDANAPHVQEADAAVGLPGNTPADTYLRADLLIEAAQRSGADAVHPGYGFLSENGAFARAVRDAGLKWIGPSPEVIDSMGSKIEAKKMMAAVGVPVLTDLDPDTLTAADLPVIVKASAGGGGRGMRVVTDLAALPFEIAAARSEAESAFGDPTVFCERYLPTGRHVEVQVLGDEHGTVWTLGERECSIQRRHQKVLEESPSPLVERTPGMRDALFAAAQAAAKSVGYVGAGTVEFLADEAGSFYFLEMNTRLQVEHPVTEAITGLDLVALQLRVADGFALPADPPARRGHSIEVRLYAEDPAADWRPQTGVLHRFSVPDVAACFTPLRAGIRLDSGVVDETVVTPHYDAMLAKVIASAPSRSECARLLATTLQRAEIHGLRTNRDLLVHVLREADFLNGDADTGFLRQHPGPEPLAAHTVRLSALAATLAQTCTARGKSPVLQGIPPSWRNVGSSWQVSRYDEAEVRFWYGRDGVEAEDIPDLRLVSAGPGLAVLNVAGVQHRFSVAVYDDMVCVDSDLGAVQLTPAPRFTDPVEELQPGSLVAPMPGRVLRIAVAAGEHVAAGQPLLWLEAMKMEHVVAAPTAGTLAELIVQVGQQVEVGAVLAVVTVEQGSDG
ncbi:MAG: acetyl/propionyl/methylcrotonyl-CoA carboxylase subunit alpha [Jatrophihabitans sp.]